MMHEDEHELEGVKGGESRSPQDLLDACRAFEGAIVGIVVVAVIAGVCAWLL